MHLSHPGDALGPSLWGGQHRCRGDDDGPRRDSTVAPSDPLPFPSQQDKSEEEAGQEPAQNTSTWEQRQPISSRLHSPYLSPPQLWSITLAAPEHTTRWLHPSPPQPSHARPPSPSRIWSWNSSNGQSQPGGTATAASLSPPSPKAKVWAPPEAVMP